MAAEWRQQADGGVERHSFIQIKPLAAAGACAPCLLNSPCPTRRPCAAGFTNRSLTVVIVAPLSIRHRSSRLMPWMWHGSVTTCLPASGCIWREYVLTSARADRRKQKQGEGRKSPKGKTAVKRGSEAHRLALQKRCIY